MHHMAVLLEGEGRRGEGRGREGRGVEGKGGKGRAGEGGREGLSLCLLSN